MEYVVVEKEYVVVEFTVACWFEWLRKQVT